MSEADALHTLGILALAHLFAVMAPGPNTALVLQTATRSRRDAFITLLGLWPAGFIYAVAGLAGLGALLAAAPWLATAMQVVCAAYLLWLGVRMLRASFRPRHAGVVEVSRANLFWQGFITNLTNPKSIVYYASIFGATGAFDLPLWAQAAIAPIMPAIGTLWYGSLALVASSGPVRSMLDSISHWLDRISGTIMIGFGLKLLVQR
jgi:threonine efflux protein